MAPEARRAGTSVELRNSFRFIFEFLSFFDGTCQPENFKKEISFKNNPKKQEPGSLPAPKGEKRF
jgi:hypothetical protein